MVASGVLDDRPVELLRGEIVEMAPEGEPHAYLITETTTYLIRTMGERATVRQDHPITLPDHGSEPEPDIAVVRPVASRVVSSVESRNDSPWERPEFVG